MSALCMQPIDIVLFTEVRYCKSHCRVSLKGLVMVLGERVLKQA